MSGEAIVLSLTLENSIKISKWKVKEGTVVSAGRVLLVYTVQADTCGPEVQKLKASVVGTVRKLLAREGDVVQPGDSLLELEKCTHPTVMKDMCAECGADLRNEKVEGNELAASIPMVHSIPELKVSAEQAQILGKADKVRLLASSKLVLLVDLDQTLIHTTNDNIPANLKDVYHFKLHGSLSPWHHTRLRPGTKSFLKNMSEYYELHICTFGSRMYAHMIANFLDPDGQYFSHRILSREECFSANSKTANLKALFPCGDNMVCIIDDREDVWNFAPNLIHVKPYHFFQHTGDINAPPGLAKQENDDKADYDFSCLGTGHKNFLDVEQNGRPLNPLLSDSVKSECDSNSSEALDLVKNKELKIDANSESVLAKDTVSEDESSTTVVLKSSSQCLESSDVLQSEEAAQEMSSSKMVAKLENLSTVSRSEEGVESSKRTETEDSKGTGEPDVKLNNPDCGETQKNSRLSEQVVKENDSGLQGVKESVLCPEPTEENKDKESQLNASPEKDETCNTAQSSDMNHSESAEVHPQGSNTGQQSEPKAEEIEVVDHDDYLLYLEDILRRIHCEFYERVKKGESPDLKEVVPAVRKKVLAGTSLVFSGLVPNNIPLERSRAYQVAVSLGAQVTQDLQKGTTHLVAVRPRTAKVNSARHMKGLYMVTADWLWSCAERWEHVDEKVFPLGRNRAGTRHPPAHCGSPEHSPAKDNLPESSSNTGRSRTASGRFMDTINPLLSFSSADIADMDQEVNDIFNESESDGEGDENSKKQTIVADVELETASEGDSRCAVLSSLKENPEDSESSSSSADSLSGEHPRGWGKHDLKRKQPVCTPGTGTGTGTDSDGDDEADDMPSAKFRRGEGLPSDLDLGENDSESEGSQEPPDEMDDGDWNMMGAALEREFLS